MKFASVCLLLAAAPAMAAPALFPKPLHIVRRVEDPFARKPIVVDQYCTGDRIVTLAGDRVTIVDYAQQQVTEIDRAASTWSVTPFSDVAAFSQRTSNQRTSKKPASASTASAAAPPRVTPLGMRSSRTGRSIDSYEVEVGNVKVVAGIDRSLALSRDAVEVLIGAAYPNFHRPEHDAILSLAKLPQKSSHAGATAMSTTATDVEFGLPSDETITVRSEDGAATTTHISIVRMDSDLPPAAALAISPEAKRVESRASRAAQETHDADTIPVAPRKQ